MFDYRDKTQEKYKKVLFIHGWGFTSKIWVNIATRFFKPDNCVFLNLYSFIDSSEGNLKTAAQEVLKQHKDIDLIFSWSLGCFLAKEIEFLRRENPIKMVYISFTPRFMKTKVWNFGFHDNTINKLKADLSINKEKALKNFYLLMLGNFKSKKEVYKKIILNVDLVLAESLGSLNSGLDIIQKSNYDNFFVEEQSLNLYIYGEGDSITPPEIKNTIKIFDSVSGIKVIPSSSHIPFLTNSDDFYKILKEFI